MLIEAIEAIEELESSHTKIEQFSESVLHVLRRILQISSVIRVKTGYRVIQWSSSGSFSHS
jgi:hypothetical protein